MNYIIAARPRITGLLLVTALVGAVLALPMGPPAGLIVLVLLGTALGAPGT